MWHGNVQHTEVLELSDDEVCNYDSGSQVDVSESPEPQ
jgi:hypothetical protein